MRRTTTAEFIDKAKKLHGNKYDYSKSEYITAKQKVKIICLVHGEFSAAPSHHLNGTGCPSCGRDKVAAARRSSTYEFIQKAKRRHGERYDYSKSVYGRSNDSLVIICPQHGEFLQRADNHLSGFGCPRCGRENLVESRKLLAHEFFSRCREAHDGRYEYPEQVYDGPDTLLKVICPDHGLFMAGARNHLWNKRRCPKCARLIGGDLRRIKPDVWIELARQTHGDRYEYDLTTFAGGAQLISMKCAKHGWFKQRGNRHLLGQGCPKCARERLIGRWKPETLSDEYGAEPCSFYYLYMFNEEEKFFKVGISNDLERRCRTLETSGYRVKVLHVKNGTRKECLEDEQAVFRAYDEIAGYVPKVAFPGHSECFAIDILGLMTG